MKSFDTFGVMIDMSRNAVMHLDGIKSFMRLLKKMGYNTVLLYMEDTYEIEGEPYFGYMRGKYTQADMIDLDGFATELGMTVIPCIQTLAHLDAFVRWGKAPTDYGNILLVDDDRTYELIERMFASLSRCFRSRKIHVGMDEAYMLGRGKHLDIHGYEQIHTIMERHLNRVKGIAEKYGYELLIWSDMYFRQWNNGKYFAPKTKVPQDIIESFPKDITPVYWDYYRTTEEEFSGMMENHLQISDKTWYAGGAWSWYGMTPFNKFSIRSMTLSLNACKKHGIRNVFLTMWGDDGGECCPLALLPSLYYLAQYAKGITDEEKIKAGFHRLIGVAFDDFMLLDTPNDIVDAPERPKNPAKYMLYSDYFNDYLDYTVKAGAGEQYALFAEKLGNVSKKTRKYGYLFDTAAKLCRLLELKYELGLKTRTAYEKGDRDTLYKLATEDYPETIRRYKSYAQAFEKQWMVTNKPHGFDVQHHRLGAMILRTDACRKRLLDYLANKTTSIPELEEPLLPFGEKENGGRFNKGLYFATANIVYNWNQ